MSLIRKTNGDIPVLRSGLSDLFDIDRFFETDLPFGSQFSKVPATNIRENDNEYTVELAAPGLEKNDFKINIENNMLNIEVQKEQETTKEEEGFTRREYNFNSFCRSFTLPEGTVNAEDIKAKYENGVLKLTLPKKEEAKKKRVKKEIKVS